MAGDLGKPGKALPAKVAQPASSGKPAGGGTAPSGSGSFKGTHTKPTNVKARPPR